MSYFVNNQNFAFGVDLSRYNFSEDLKQKPDFREIRAHRPEVSFVALRSGVSWGYRDPAFRYFLQEAKAMNACILPYHVLYPGEPARKQMDAFISILEGVDLDSVRLVLDAELEHQQSRSAITNTLLSSLERLHSLTGRWPIVYSRAMWVDQHLHISDLPEVDWWLAQYYPRQAWPAYTPEYPCPPRLPQGVNRWLIHQTTERGPAIGGPGNYMDYNRWNGDKEALLSYFGRAPRPTPLSCPIDGKPCGRGQPASADVQKELQPCQA